ncbi:hypothetical protein HUU39_13850 [candidate division KSB1 bacterium]|nr:hypothetical protein [bacterium]NUM66349.1 hypothetical protein [candidate division KSB1 bacterium]
MQERMLQRSGLLMGALCALVGAAVGQWAASLASSADWALLPIFSGAASFLSGWFCWQRLLARRVLPPGRRAALAGVLAALLGHYLTFYCYFLWANIEYWICNLRSGQPPADILNGLWGAGVLALWSLLFYGWLTLPVGGLLGAGLLTWLRRKQPFMREEGKSHAGRSGTEK